MLLIGQHGTTKYVVRSLVLRWKHSQPLSRCYATTSQQLSDTISSTENSAPIVSDHPEKSYAVLGGGVTGLSAAYFLTRKFSKAKVTIYEANKRLGGWVDSEIVEVDGGQVLFEWGPRSLRPDFSGTGNVTIQLVRCSLWRRKQQMLTIRTAA
jgi:hypothetical protein